MTSMTNMLLDFDQKDPKYFWDMINKMISWSSEQQNKDEYIKVSTWVDQFKRLFHKEMSDLNCQVPHQIPFY